MTDTALDTFAQRLTAVVEDFTRSRAAAAREFGIGDTTLKSYMAGLTEPGVSELISICDRTGTRIEWLLMGKGPRRLSEESTEVSPGEVNNWFHRELVNKVVVAFEEELLKRKWHPSPAQRATMVTTFCHLFRRSGQVEVEALKMVLDASTKA